jgi:hypothetical protein
MNQGNVIEAHQHTGDFQGTVSSTLAQKKTAKATWISSYPLLNGEDWRL